MPPQRAVRRAKKEAENSDSSDEHGSDSDSSGPKTGENKVQWVACDKCGQWRKMSGLTDLKTLPKRWFCSMNPDPRFNDCSIPEV